MPTVERRVWIELALEGRDSINHVKKACGTPKSIGAVKGCRSEWKHKVSVSSFRCGSQGYMPVETKPSHHIYYIG